MSEYQASRTLLKSPPELWTECSDAHSLARHLGEFGEIKITRLEPERTVAWEGESASGTVTLEPSGWGTRVTLTARTEAAEDIEPEPIAAPDPPEPVQVATPDPEPEEMAPSEPPPAAPPEPPRDGLLLRIRRWFAPPPAPAPDPVTPPPPPEPLERAAVAPQPPTEPELPPLEPDPLSAALDSLGQAHHRPFSRA